MVGLHRSVFVARERSVGGSAFASEIFGRVGTTLAQRSLVVKILLDFDDAEVQRRAPVAMPLCILTVAARAALFARLLSRILLLEVASVAWTARHLPLPPRGRACSPCPRSACDRTARRTAR